MNKWKILIMMLTLIDCTMSYGSARSSMPFKTLNNSVYSFIYTGHDCDSLTDREKEECADYSARLSYIDDLCNQLIQSPDRIWIQETLNDEVRELISLAPSRDSEEQIILWISQLKYNKETKGFYEALLSTIGNK